MQQIINNDNEENEYIDFEPGNEHSANFNRDILN
jgi:hypothetical protein